MKSDKVKIFAAVGMLVVAAVLLIFKPFGGGGGPKETPESQAQNDEMISAIREIDPKAAEPPPPEEQPVPRVPRNAIKPGEKIEDPATTPADPAESP